MKRILFTLLIVLFSVSCYARKYHVNYTYKALYDEGCSVLFTPKVYKGDKILTVQVSSDRMGFTEEPEITFKISDGTILQLKGRAVGASSETGLLNVGLGINVPITTINAIAEFPMTFEQICLLNLGITKVRINTSPIVHQREFRKKNKIGQQIYNIFIESMEEDKF